MRSARLTALALALAIGGVSTAGCGGGSTPPATQPSPRPLELTTSQIEAAFQRPGVDKQGREWQVYEDAALLAATNPLELCGNASTSSPPPDGPDKTPLVVLHLPALTEGSAAILQFGMVYPDEAGATAAVEALGTEAMACPSDATVPRQARADGKFIPMSQVTWAADSKSEQGWTGFTGELSSTNLEGEPRANTTQHLTVLSSGNAVVALRLSSIRKATRPGNLPLNGWITQWTQLVPPILERLNTAAR